MIRENLKLSYEERVAQHQKLLDFIEDLKKAGMKHGEKTSKKFLKPMIKKF